MNIKAVCFDIDGTMYPLWMTKVLLVPTFFPSISLVMGIQSFRKSMRQPDTQETTPPNLEGFRSRQTLYVKHKLQSSLPLDAIEKKIDAQFYKNMESSFSHIHPYKGLRETLLFLKDRAVKVGALSDFPIHSKLETLSVDDLIDFSACTEESGYLKPHKAPFEILSKIPKECIEELEKGRNVSFTVIDVYNIDLSA